MDVVYYGNQRQLENDFVVSPGVDPKVINLAFDGAKKLSTDTAGNLVLETASGLVQLQKPVAYQEVDGSRHDIAVRYNFLDAEPSLGNRQLLIGKQSVGFEVAAYDHSVPLVIDPVVVFSSSILDHSVQRGQLHRKRNRGKSNHYDHAHQWLIRAGLRPLWNIRRNGAAKIRLHRCVRHAEPRRRRDEQVV